MLFAPRELRPTAATPWPRPQPRSPAGPAGAREIRRSRSSMAHAVVRSGYEYRGRFGQAQRAIVVLDQLADGNRRNLEHRPRENAKQDGEDRKRPERDDFAVIEILD